MSDSNLSGFVAKHKVAILATLGVAASAATAYYVLNQAPSSSPSSSGGDSAASKSKKKKNKKKAKSDDSSAASSSSSPATPKIYPVDAQGFPALTEELIKALSPEDAEKYSLALKEDGNDLFKDKNFEDAIKFYSAALDIKKDPVFYSNRSACYVGLQDYERVVQDTSLALELKPDYTKCLIRRSNAFEQLGKYEAAMFDLTAVTVLGGFNNKGMESSLDRVLKKQSHKVVQEKMANVTPQLPSPSSTSSFFLAFDEETTVEGLPTDPLDLQANTGDFFLISGLQKVNEKSYEGYESADSFFQQAVSAYEGLSDKDESTKKKLAVAYEYSGVFKFLKSDPLNALADIEKSLSLNPRPRAYVFQALIFADKQDFTSAEATFNKALDLNPESAEVYYHKGQVYYLTAALDKAKENFEKAKEFNPENVYAYIQLACIIYRKGDFKAAADAFQEAKKKFPTSPEIPNYYGEILGDKGDIEGALKQFDISYKLQEALPKISIGVIPLVNKAAMLSREATPENIAESIELLEKAIDADPKAELAKVTLAQLKLQTNKPEEAIKLFEEAADLSRSFEDKVQATSFAEATKIQLKVKSDPLLSKKVEELISQYGAQGLV